MDEQQEKQLLIRMDINIHSEVKARCARRNVSMNLWILRAIKDALEKEDKYK